MPLIPEQLAISLNTLSKKAESTPMTSEEFNAELAIIITNHILTATITTPNGTGVIL